MRIYEYTPGKKLGCQKRIVALGYFDGVHIGHRHLISLARTLADKAGLPLAVFTFSVGTALSKGGNLYTSSQRLALLEELGADEVICADFDAVKNLSPEEFIEMSLIGDMMCAGAVCGFDFRFGKGAMGDAALLSRALSEMGIRSLIADEQMFENEKISTTRIKSLLLDGNVAEARKLLGAPYFIEGEVKRGDGRGKTLGFPTVNTDFDIGQLCPRHGVYRSCVALDGKLYNAITNIGTCPTFGERREHAESYIIDFKGNLYGKKLRIFLLGYLREEKVFSGADELIMQINVDINRAIKENGELKWQEIGQSLQHKQV